MFLPVVQSECAREDSATQKKTQTYALASSPLGQVPDPSARLQVVAKRGVHHSRERSGHDRCERTNVRRLHQSNFVVSATVAIVVVVAIVVAVVAGLTSNIVFRSAVDVFQVYADRSRWQQGHLLSYVRGPTCAVRRREIPTGTAVGHVKSRRCAPTSCVLYVFRCVVRDKI